MSPESGVSKRSELVTRLRSIDWQTFSTLAEEVKEEFVLARASGKRASRKAVDGFALLMLIALEKERRHWSSPLVDLLNVTPPGAVSHAIKLWVKSFDRRDEIAATTSFTRLMMLVLNLKKAQFQAAFPVILSLMRELEPERIAREIAQRTAHMKKGRVGERLFGLPRPAELRRRHSAVLPEHFSAYRKLWTLAFQTFQKRRTEIRAHRKLAGHFKQSWGLQGRSIRRLLAEEEGLRSSRFYSASIVWSCVAVEVFMSKVVIDALIRAIVVDKESASEMIEEFRKRGGKTGRVNSVLNDHYRFVVRRSRHWSAYTKLVERRNEIVHKGKRGSRHEAELFATTARGLIEEIRTEVAAALP